MADTIPKIIGMARRANLDAVADRLDYLHSLERDDEDPINLDAVKSLVLFIKEHAELSTCGITIDADGFAHVEWALNQNSTLYAQFGTSDNVRFIYSVNEASPGHPKILKTGYMPPNDMLKEIIPFVAQQT